MSSPDFDRLNAAKLSELANFNREVSALIRSGLPLELGLGAGRVDSLSGRIGQHLREGRTLADALEQESASMPSAYLALVRAGTSAGNLPGALDAVTRSARTIAALRKKMALAMIYPSLVIVLASLLAIFVIARLSEAIRGQFLAMHESPPWLIEWFLWLIAENPWGWLYWAPAVVLLLAWGLGGTRFLTLRMPGIGRVLRYYRIAVFAELAAAMLESRVPLERAWPLAAAAAGDRRLTRDAQAIVKDLEAGRSLAAALERPNSLPRFARWMIAAGASQNSLPATLSHVARWASRRGESGSQWYGLYGPVALTMALGATTLIFFTVVSFGPVIALIWQLAQEGSR